MHNEWKVETWLCGIMFTIGMGVLPIFLVVVILGVTIFPEYGSLTI